MTTTPLLAPRALAMVAVFHDLPDAGLAAAAACARLRRLPKEMRIFSQGDEGARAHAVIEGGVRIAQSGSDGAQVIVRFVGPGEMFGTVAIFTGGRYPADAITVVETLDASWSEAELLELIGAYPQIGVNLIRIIGKRLQEMQERVRELATQRAERRVAHAVLRLAQQAGLGAAEGTAIAFPLRRKDLADIAGATLHTVSRILTAWEKAGFLATRNQRLTIREPSAILRISEEADD